MKLFFFFIIALKFCFAVENPIKINEHLSTILSSTQQNVFKETNESYTVEDIRHRTDQGIKDITTPSTQDRHWIRFQLYNASTQPQQIILQHPRAGLDYIDLYIFQEDNLYKKSELGDLRSSANRSIIHKNSAELLTLQPKTTYTIISRLQSYGPYELWWSIENMHYFTLHSSIKTIVWGFLGGILISLMIYSMILYFTFHQISYVIYCCYALCLLLFHFIYQGLFYQYFPNINLKLLTISSWVTIYLLLFFLLLFPYFFFKLQKDWLGKPLLAFALLALLCALFYSCAIFDMNLLYFTRYTTPINLSFSLYLIILCVIVVVQKRPGSLYFAIARGVFTLCAIYDTFIVGGYLKQETFSWLVLPFGIGVDLVFLALAHGRKVQLLQQYHHDNEQLLIAQARFVAVGQTIGNITHQWKTPIVQLASQFMFLQATFIHRKELFLNEFEKKIPQILQSIAYIQESIHLFANFYKHSNAKTHFNPIEEMQIIQKMLETKLMLHMIDFKISSDVQTIYTHKNALMNILMILCENAIDALLHNDPAEKHIDITFKKQNNALLEISIQDSAGKMPLIQFEQIFSSYYSTKKDNFGMGLSLVKLLVEKKLEGKIFATNEERGLRFTIKLLP